MIDFAFEHKNLFGKNSFKAPLNLVAQSQSENLNSFVGFTNYEHFPLDVDLDKNHILFIGEIAVRPHYIIATNRYKGIGLDGIYIDNDKEMIGDNDELLIDNVSHFEDKLNKRTATEHAKDDIHLRMLSGVYTAHIPCWFVMQGHGNNQVGIVGASKTDKLLYGTDKTHTIIKGDSIFRPHMIYAGDSAMGSGINGLATGAHFKIRDEGELIFVDDIILNQIRNQH